MSKIKIMSENLANKISAGEVIEKCASVVKELVENSIDAGSTHISIDLTNGGLSSISVIDDGIGMNKEDALLCFSRHATSKLLKEDDLFFINTLGFRGEALPSIASVSEVTLKTSTGDSGTYIHIKGGSLVEEKDSDLRIGTSITVSNLFYNTPARLKYLKSEQTELANTTNYIEKLAMSKPDISFTLTNNEHVIVKTSGSNNLLKAIHEIYGRSISSKMLEIKCSNDDYDVYGYICKPEVLKSNRNHMTTIINGRVIKNNELNKAINDAYYTYKPDIKYPVVVLNVETDPTLIDVNIHPTKQDVKLSKISSLTTMLIDTIKDALYHSELVPTVKLSNDTEVIKNQILEQKITNDILKEDDSDYQTVFDFGSEEVITPVLNEKNEVIKSLVLYPVGLALGTYIIAENEDGLYLIDQHAAEERINYEKYFKALKEKEISSISLLFPITIELSPSDYMLINSHLDYLNSIGFKVEDFGINTIIIKEHPTWIKEGYEEEQIRMLIDMVIVSGKSFDINKFNEHVSITLACKTSIKANYRITNEEMEEILSSLVKCDNPYNCPHGRPTIVKFTKYELEKMFKRVMN